MVRGFGYLLIIATVVAVKADDAQPEQVEPRGFVDRVFTDDAGEHRYVVFVPQENPPENGWPVILFLHGAGERGTDGRRQLAHGLGPLVKLRAETFPAVVVFPQAEDMDGPILRTWSANSADGRRALAILDEVEAQYPVDPTHHILTGWSMGGYGTWRLAAADPERWSAIVPLSGGGDLSTANRLSDVNTWAFHGAQDRIVPVAEGRAMATAVREAGGHILYSEAKAAGHDIWRRVYDSDVVLDWMLSPDGDRHDLESVPLPDDRTRESPELVKPDFVPALVIERALALRLGSDAMQTIAHGLPALFAEEGLSGEMADVNDRLEMDDRTFDIRFGEMTFNAALERVILRPRGADRLQAEMALRNVTLRVGTIEVTDGEVGFQAGQAEVIVGHRAPVWLKVEVRPTVVDQQLSLKLLRSSFEIPDTNWFVRKPESITLQGDWLNEEEVTTAVVGGIYVRRETIEQQVLSVVPALLTRFAEEVRFDPLALMVQALWPLPVYQPDIQVHPESVSTDADGVSLTLSVTVAAVDPTQNEPVQTVRASGPSAYDIKRTTDLRAGVAVDVLDHISSMLAGTPAARIYASDIPGLPFAELTELTSLSRVIPGLDHFAPESEVRVAFILEEPLSVRPDDHASQADRDRTGLMIEVPRLAMNISVVTVQPTSRQSDQPTTNGTPIRPPLREPVPLFDGTVHVRQPLTLSPAPMTDGEQGLQIVWGSETEVTTTGHLTNAETSSPQIVDEAELAKLFDQGWRRWTAAQEQHVVTMPAIALGETRLSLREMAWSGLCLSATFSPAATKLANSSESPVTYRVRGPHSRWSKARTLAPGAVTAYETGADMVLRPHRHREFDNVHLPTGSSWEWRLSLNSQRPAWIRIDRSNQAGPSENVSDVRETTVGSQ